MFGLLFGNILIFLLIYYIYRKDCKDIGKENLTIPLFNRFGILIVMEFYFYMLLCVFELIKT